MPRLRTTFPVNPPRTYDDLLAAATKKYNASSSAYENMKIIESGNVVEQFRFPKSRKKRIRNKWAKRPQNWRPDLKHAYQMGDSIICHPIFAQCLRASCADEARAVLAALDGKDAT